MLHFPHILNHLFVIDTSFMFIYPEFSFNTSKVSIVLEQIKSMIPSHNGSAKPISKMGFCLVSNQDFSFCYDHSTLFLMPSARPKTSKSYTKMKIQKILAIKFFFSPAKKHFWLNRWHRHMTLIHVITLFWELKGPHYVIRISKNLNHLNIGFSGK